MAKTDDELQELGTEVARIAGAVDSAIAAFNGVVALNESLKEQLENAAGGLTEEQVAMFDAHQAALKANAERLATSIVAMP